MEQRISFKRTMATAKVFCIVTLSSLLFQAAAYIFNRKISLLSINGTDYIFTQMNRSSCSNKIDELGLKLESGIFVKEYPQMISHSTSRTLKQLENRDMTSIKACNSWTLNENTHGIKRCANRNMGRNRSMQRINELQANKQNNRASGQRDTNMLSRWRHTGSKEDSKFLESKQSTNSHKLNENNIRHTEHGLNHIAIFSWRISEPSNSRTSIGKNNGVREMRNIRRAKDEKERIKYIRHVDRSNYATNYFVRLLRKEQSHSCLERCSKFSSRSTKRENCKKQINTSTDRSDQEKIMSEKSREKHDSSLAVLMLERKIQKARNAYAFTNEVQHARHLVRSSTKNVESQRRRATERIKSITLTKQFPGQESQNAIITYERHNFEQNERSFPGVFRMVTLEESHAIGGNIQFFRKLSRFTNRVDDIRHSNTRVSKERRTKTTAQGGQEKILSKKYIQDRSFKRILQHSMQKSPNVITLKQDQKRRTYEDKQLHGILMKVSNVFPSEISAKAIQASQQQTECKKELERLIQREEKRIRNLEKYHERRQQLRFSERLTSKRMQNTGFSGSSLNGQNNYLTPSGDHTRREADNRLLSGELQRIIQHKESSQQSSTRSLYTNRSRRSEERIFNSRCTQRLVDSRFDNRKYLQRTSDETENIVRSQYRTIRSAQHSDKYSIRSKGLVAYKHLFQEQIVGKKGRRKVDDERRYERISEISYNSRTHNAFYRKQNDSSKLYRYSEDVFPTDFAEVFIKQTNKKPGNGYRESFMRTKTLPKIRTSRTEIITMSSIEEEHHFKPSSVQSQTYNVPKVIKKIKRGMVSWEVTSLESRFSPSICQKSSIEENEHGVNNLWNAVTKILGIFLKVGHNTLEWKAAYFGDFPNDVEMKQELFSPDHSVTKSLFRNNRKRSYGMQDVVIAGIGMFAAVKLHSTKSMD